jgi:uncharacterized protein
MIKAVVDTNVFISGVFWKGPPFEVLKSWRRGDFRWAVSEPILEEYRRTLDQLIKKRLAVGAQSILAIIESHAEIVEPVAFARQVCSDPDDDKFLEAAVAAHADFVVSGDFALLELKRYREIEIVRPTRFLSILRS